ncbi:MAG TPA: hypothetical protein VEI97_16380 [bacterium]|nr:hypothetical protein [bacterium]
MFQSVSLRPLSLLTLSLTLLLATSACKRDRDEAPAPSDTELRSSTEDQATAENDDALVAEFVEADAPEEARAADPLSPDSLSSRVVGPGGCAQRSWDPATRTLTIDFGPTNCRCRDGRFRRGIIRAVFNGPRRAPGSSVTITRHNYFVNDNQHLGTKVITFTNHNQWHVSVTGGQVIFQNGGQTSWSCERDVTRTIPTPGSPTVFTVTGQASGTTRRGVSYTATILQPLVRHLEWGCAAVFIDGTLLITRSNERDALLNYNPAGTTPPPCDRLASITVNGTTRNITLR